MINVFVVKSPVGHSFVFPHRIVRIGRCLRDEWVFVLAPGLNAVTVLIKKRIFYDLKKKNYVWIGNVAAEKKKTSAVKLGEK